MPRRSREEEEGALHHVFARGSRKAQVFHDPADRHVYLDLLSRTVDKHAWLCLAYCLMGNHVHLLVETPRTNLGLGMQYLHGRYGAYYSRRYALPGHVFHGPYGSKRVKDDAQLWTAVRYIARNPVEAGLCARPEEWVWGSHGRRPEWLAHARLLEFFAAAGGDAAARYDALVEASSEAICV